MGKIKTAAKWAGLLGVPIGAGIAEDAPEHQSKVDALSSAVIAYDTGREISRIGRLAGKAALRRAPLVGLGFAAIDIAQAGKEAIGAYKAYKEAKRAEAYAKKNYGDISTVRAKLRKRKTGEF